MPYRPAVRAILNLFLKKKRPFGKNRRPPFYMKNEFFELNNYKMISYIYKTALTLLFLPARP